MLYVRGTKVRRTTYAEVLELADRHDSGSCVGNDVWVQVPFSALINIFKGVIRLIPITPFLHFIFTIVIKTCNTGYYNCYPNL